MLLLDYYKCVSGRGDLPVAIFPSSLLSDSFDYCSEVSPYPQLDAYNIKKCNLEPNFNLHVKGVLDLDTGVIDKDYIFTPEDYITYTIFSSYGDAGVLQPVYNNRN
ncbi:MAG: hypothetical protein PHO23_02865 [Candidatus Pacebacteria bacterium]|nr:hypothetical protein [Candidatus Paceibacterota bacterium]